MSTTTDPAPTIEAPTSARDFLLGGESTTDLRTSLDTSGCLQDALGGRPGRAVSRVLGDQVAGMSAAFLDVDLGEVALRGWALHERLRKAALETAATPGSMSIVDLADHTVSSTWRPTIEVLVGGVTRGHLVFELTVTFEVSGLLAVVENGLLARLGGGSCRVGARFGVAGRTLVERSARFDPGLAIPLGPGVPLLQGAAARPGSVGPDDETAQGAVSLPRDRVSPRSPGVSL